MSQTNEWWHEFFPIFRPLFGKVSAQTTQATVRYVIKKLDLIRGKTFLDCPSGYGRISVPLARRGIRVTGADTTKSYIEELDRTARRYNLPIRTQRSDMRRIQFENEFDAAGNLWTSFGYFEKESDNLLTLKRMYRALKPGSKFMLHVINRDWIMAHYQPRGWDEIDDLKALEVRHFEFETSINRGIWTFIKDGQEREVRGDIRMYSYHELIAMFKSVGFEDIHGYGSVKDDPINQNQMMMFITGTKPASRRPDGKRRKRT